MKECAGRCIRRLSLAVLRIDSIPIFGGGVFITFSAIPIDATAKTALENDVGSTKAYWQERYRGLRDEAARLRKKEADVARTAYASANRRN